MPDLIGLNQITTTGANGLSLTKLASGTEFVQEWKVSDDATSYLRVGNDSATAAEFVPRIYANQALGAATQPGLLLYSHIPLAQDSGTVPIFVFTGRTAGGAALTVRPIYDFRTGTTSLLKVNADGTVDIETNLKLDAAGLTAVRTFTWPDATGKVTTEAATQTLTNKTLTTPVLTTPTINGHKYTDLPKTSNYTLLATDSVIRADASAGAFTLTLPAAATAGAGTVYTIIRVDVANSTNLLTIDANSTELINGQLTFVLYPAESVVIECTGTAWECISQPPASPTGYYFEKGATANQRYLAGMLNQTIALLTSTTGPTVNTLYAMPFIVTRTTKFDTISFELTTTGAGSNARVGIYADTGNCYPGALIFDSGNISTASGTGVKDSTITSSLQIFSPGLYWLTYENSATVPQIRILPASGYLSLFPGTLGTAIPAYAYTVAHTVGALPNPYTGGATKRTAVSAVGSPIPAVGLRAV
jgi:hypothetical protein